jgi:Thrombospondin type 1 domain
MKFEGKICKLKLYLSLLHLRWIAEEWNYCSKSCGAGTRDRIVVCAEESNGIKNKVPDEACRGVRPKAQEPCNTHECPKWIVGDWSGVSTIGMRDHNDAS